MNEKFEKYYNFLISENEKYNLTSITKKEEVEIKHFEDSLNTSLAIDFNSVNTLCDVGSGAGFPSIPLKIKFPHLKITIIEPTKKRCNFLEQLVLLLDLKDVIIICDRSENVNYLRNTFDVVVARAVSNLPMLLELCLPLVKVNGFFISLKGNNFMEELNASKNALKELDSKVIGIIDYNLSNNFGKHYLIKVLKEKETKLKYPRKFSEIKKKPL